jgi:hypothetical protein
MKHKSWFAIGLYALDAIAGAAAALIAMRAGESRRPSASERRRASAGPSSSTTRYSSSNGIGRSGRCSPSMRVLLSARSPLQPAPTASTHAQHQDSGRASAPRAYWRAWRQLPIRFVPQRGHVPFLSPVPDLHSRPLSSTASDSPASGASVRRPICPNAREVAK